MHYQYLNSIALYQHFGCPHFFITMTTNSNWKEIQENLVNGENPLDRLDLVSRVFKLKKQQLIKDLASEMIFGKPLARTHSIEFQKRGYPHIHNIMWLDMERVRHLGPETIDKSICAVIPNEYTQQKNENKEHPRAKNPLHAAVISFMLHGPCAPEMSCMKKRYCQYGYRKDYSSETMMSEDGYPMEQIHFFIYRKGKPVTYTNGGVVSYNKYPLYKYNCHINVEYCHLVMTIKYHLKYINKGSNEAIITVGGKQHNKILETQKIIRTHQQTKSDIFRTSGM